MKTQYLYPSPKPVKILINLNWVIKDQSNEKSGIPNGLMKKIM